MTQNLSRLGCALAGALALITPALWNGFPLLQYDTGGYLARWFEGYLVPSRAVTYGLFLTAGYPLDFWPTVVLQAAAAVWVIDRTLHWHGMAERPIARLAIVCALAATTALPWIASVLLTDIFAGLAVLALHLLAFKWERIGTVERIGLIGFAAFAASTHGATILMIAALAVLFIGFAIVRRAPRGAIAGVVSVPILGALMLLAANYVLVKRIAWTPGGYGIAFGRMLEDGFVRRYLDDHCPDEKLRLCPHRTTMPQTADEFLWGSSVFNDLGRFNGLGEEMRTIVLGSLTDYPAAQLAMALRAGIRQIVYVRTGEGFINTIWHTYGMMEAYTPSVLPALRAARQQREGLSFTSLNAVHIPAALIGMALLPLVIWLGWRRREFADIGLLAASATLAILANAFVCGVLSNPHNRYGSRIVWIAVFVSLIAAWRMWMLRDATRRPSLSRRS